MQNQKDPEDVIVCGDFSDLDDEGDDENTAAKSIVDEIIEETEADEKPAATHPSHS